MKKFTYSIVIGLAAVSLGASFVFAQTPPPIQFQTVGPQAQNNTNTTNSTNTTNNTTTTNTTTTTNNSGATPPAKTVVNTQNGKSGSIIVGAGGSGSTSAGGSGSTSAGGSGSTSAGGSGSTTGGTGPIGKIDNPINVNSLSDFVAKVLGIILKIAIPIVAAFIIYAGFAFVMARGNAEKIEQAKTRFLYTLIGAGILLGAWMIAEVIKATVDALTA